MDVRITRLGLALAMLALGCQSDKPAISPLAGPAAQGAHAADPALAQDPDNGDVLLTWVAGDSSGWALYFSRSSDQGATWTAPVRVNDRDHDIHPHGEASPRLIAARGGALGVAWPHSYKVPGRKWGATHMRFARSVDGGRTWQPTVTINDDSAGAPGSHTFHGAAWDGERDFVVAWLDERQAAVSPAAHAAHSGTAGAHTPAPDEEGDATVFVARSRDLGATWDRANEAKWGAACPCCRVALARAPDGSVRAAWRKHFPVNIRDVVAGPLAGGDSAQIPVHRDGWVFRGCPHTGPAVAVDGRGATHVTWFTGAEGSVGIRHARAPDGAAAFEPAAYVLRGQIGTAHVAVAGLPGGGSVVVADRDHSGAARIVVAAVDRDGGVGNAAVLAASADADHPAVVALDDSTALVGWTRQDRQGPSLQLATVRLPRRHES